MAKRGEQYYEDQPGGGRVTKVYLNRPVRGDGSYGTGGKVKWGAWTRKPRRLIGFFDHVAEARRASRGTK